MMKTKQPAEGKRGRIADSIAQAVPMSGFPRSVLTWAKNHGCPAFRGGRVYVNEVEVWLEKNKPKLDGRNLPAKNEMQVLILMEVLKEKQNKRKLFEEQFIKTSDVSRIFTGIALNQRQVLIQELQNNLPPKLEGLRAPEMIVIMRETADRILAMMRAGIDSIKEAEKNRKSS